MVIPSNAQNAIDYRERSGVRVDTATGALQFQITLGSYKGRAGLDLPVTLYYSSKVWEISHLGTIFRGGECAGCAGEPDSTYGGFFALYSAAGWTSNLDWFKWREPPSFETYDEMGRACLTGCSSRVARLFLRLPDGSRPEFRRDDTIYPFFTDVLAGTYYSVDGSRMRYDASSGTLYLPDGSRYLSERTDAGVFLSHYVDRHGNRLSYDDSTKQWTDTLGRSYGLPPLDTSEPVDRTYTLPGTDGTSRSVTFVWRRLGGVLTDPSQQLHFVGDRTTSYPHLPVSPHLFTSPGGPNDSMVDGYGGQPFNPVVLHKIVLPDESAYTFTYNVYGEIEKVVYPTGGYEKFTYGGVPPLSAHVFDLTPAPQANRGVRQRRVSARGDGSDEVIWGYAPGPLAVVTAPDGTRTETYHHVSEGGLVLYGFDNPLAGRAYEERVVTASGRVLKRRLTEWATDGTTETRGAHVIHKRRNPRVTKEVLVVLNAAGGASSATTKYEYDADLNPKKVERYGYREVTETNPAAGGIASFQPGDLLRVEETDYLTDNQAYRDRNMLSLPKATRVRDGAGTLLAQTETRYDEAAYAPLPCGAAVGWGDPGALPHGLATTTRSWLNTTGGWIETHARFDQCGSLREDWDAHEETAQGHGREFRVEYADAFSDGAARGTFAYPTRTISVVPDQTGAKGLNAPLETESTYDFQTGLVVSATDINNQATTNYSYRDADSNIVDPLGRLRKVSLPDGGWTRYDYGSEPSGFFVRTRTAIDDTRATDSYQFFDGLGRPSRAYAFDGSAPGRTWVATKTQHYEQTRRVKTSNPHFRTNLLDFDLDSASDPIHSTTITSDPLGRMASVQSPDGATVVTEYNGIVVTVTDQAGKKRSSVSDALGRLVKVIEAPGVTDYDYETTYEVDALGNVRKVIQGRTGQAQQTRIFNYDSLSRLTSAAQPESGTVFYEYDAAGNLKKRVDARHVRTDYEYDGLNRLVSRSYSIESGHQPPAGYVATPAVVYYYDGTGMPTSLPTPTRSAGRLTAVKSSVSETIYTQFDAAGRVKAHRQVVHPGTSSEQQYLMRNGYNLAGNLTSQTYPSGKVVETEYDGAARVVGVKNQATGSYYAGAAADSTNRITYAAHGAVEALKLGNGLWKHTAFNSRLQPEQISLGSSPTNPTRLRLTYGYGPAAENNGNVRSQRIEAEGLDVTQTYEYDAVNRLLSAREAATAGGPDAWRQSYTYLDSTGRNGHFGNRRVDTGSDPVTGLPRTTANATPQYNPQINPATNHYDDNQGYTYDPSGNLRQDPSHSYSYDAENRVVAVDGGWDGTSGASYFYDGDGRRVQKASAAEVTVFVYDVFGRLAAEYSNLLAAGGTSYLTQDALGSTRVMTDADGRLKSRHDYFPFGEEISAGVCGRTTSQGYSQYDGARQRFTGAERDDETGLDFMQARYYGSAQGRFTSPDPLLASGKPSSPQSWNRYAYVGNNPLAYIDPSGMLAVPSTDEEEQRRRQQQQQQQQQQQRPRVVLIVGDPGLGQNNGGRNYQRAAETRQAQLEQAGTEVIVVRASNVQDFNRALTSNGTLNGVEYFGHAGPGQLFIGENPGRETNLNSETISELSNSNLAPGATIKLHGCSTAVPNQGNDSIARQVANQLQRNTFGYTGDIRFSSNPTAPTGATRHPSTGPTYMAPERGVRMVGFTPYIPVRLPYAYR